MGESIYQAAREEKNRAGEAGRRALERARRKTAEGNDLVIKIEIL